jgi:hypothetical protein
MARSVHSKPLLTCAGEWDNRILLIKKAKMAVPPKTGNLKAGKAMHGGGGCFSGVLRYGVSESSIGPCCNRPFVFHN